ncbi:MAG: M23 family metallopeptidase [Prolixibacteraceae bacterium]|jgi:murein DD-endopeptidase MepM/ murein hydrolase activator NlpD|nr:M23 family metallopeptidase [Prolixibacteraceae bacterium]MDI9562777.1 M23 family metallopeptidase [Bacteroidota bacterium]NLS99722.1 M23 family metallopeptidase [Bacteroidales bacterium]OQB81779.1 MAG: Murein DD-endopeptidase MepM [Bacteroidetes bacterium ADurb.Bin123]HNU77629.1 M23 family metallopeptidase [Prolixibacteraceae bacterium]
MTKNNFRKNLSEKLRSKFRLIIYNDTSFQSVWTMKLSPLRVFTFVSLFSVVLISLVVFLVASTPLREYIPGYPNEEEREMLFKNVVLLDSLENELAKRDKFFEDMRMIISGEVPKDNQAGGEVTEKPAKVTFTPYNHDSVFQDKILEERLNLSARTPAEQGNSPEKIHFFQPTKGLITNKFDLKKAHYGVDLVGQPNSRISAVLGGTVLFAGWTIQAGHVIFLLHGNNLTSAYMHNAELLKKTGDQVKAGEAIAIIGNTGELTTGPHLHFELWHNGIPVDPEKYIVF